MQITWTSLASGDWDVGTNWSSNPVRPGAGDTVAITSLGSYLISESGDRTVASILFDDPAGTLVISGVLSAGAITVAEGTLIMAGATVLTLDGNQGTITLGSAVLALQDGTLGASTLSAQGGVLDDLTLSVTGSAATLDDATPYYGGYLSEGKNSSYTIGTRGTVEVNDPGETLSATGYLLTNDGTINVGGTNDAIVAQLYTFVNNGQITLSNGALFRVAGQQLYPGLSDIFDNAGQITIASGATLAVAGGTEQFANSGTITLADPSSTLALDGADTATAMGDIVANGGILSIGGTFDNTGNTLVIGPASGFGALTFSGDQQWGKIEGGTIINTSTVGLAGAGILENLVWEGPLFIGNDVPVTNINVPDASEIQPAPGGGHRLVRFSGLGGDFIVGTGLIGRDDVLSAYSITDAALNAAIIGLSTLTVDSTTTISIFGSTVPAGITYLGQTAPLGLSISANSVINDGLLENDLASGYTLSLGGGNFVNAGTILVSGTTNAVAVNTGSFINTGSLLVTDGAVLELDAFDPDILDAAAFNNTGLISLDASSTLVVSGTFSASQLAPITTAGGEVILTGSVTNSGNTLSLTVGGEFGNVTFGVIPPASSIPQINFGPANQSAFIQGGTVVEAGGNVVVQNTTLDGVAWVGSVDLFEPRATLAVINGSTLIGPAGVPETISMTGADDTLIFDNAVLTATTFYLGATGATVTVDGTNLLTLAAGTTLDMTTPDAGQINLLGNITNLGLIDDQSGSVQIGLPPPTFLGGEVFILPGESAAIIPSSPSLFDNQGIIIAAAGAGSAITIDNQTSFINAGLIQVDNGDHLIVRTTSFTNTGTLVLGAGTIEFVEAIANLGTIAFSPDTTGTLIFDRPSLTYNDPIINLGFGNRIEFGDSVDVFSADVTAPGTVTIITSIGSVSLNDVTFDIGGAPGFTVGIDNLTGDAFVSVAPCFAAGTRIAVEHGEMEVQCLRMGDRVRTISGQLQSISWIGRRSLDCRRHVAPERVKPIRIARHAFGENRPKRALLLSPDHSVFMEDVLIPVKFLVNNSTIAQLNVAKITYYHLELSSHDIVLAEGLPTETYLETGGRLAFENADGATQLHPDFEQDEARVGMLWREFGYAPLIGNDGQFERVFARITAQALMLGYDAHGRSPRQRSVSARR